MTNSFFAGNISDMPWKSRWIQNLARRPPFEKRAGSPIHSFAAAPAAGPYSQAIKVYPRGWLICSGQIGLDPKTSLMAGGTVKAQAEQVFKNIQAVLSQGGASLDQVVKTTVFLTDIKQFELFNEVYASYFKKQKPSRSLVEVSALPKGALVEMEAWAVL